MTIAAPPPPAAAPDVQSPAFHHEVLPCGIEFAVERLAERDTVALVFRILTGVADDPEELTGVGMITERTLSKGTKSYGGRALADAFDRLGIQWSSVSGRQSTVLRVLCLPEFVPHSVELMAEMLRRPKFPDDAVKVNVDLARQDLKHMEDDPQDLVRVMIQKMTLGPVFGRHVGGEPDTLPRITRKAVAARWESAYGCGRMQVSAAGPVDIAALREQISAEFERFGAAQPVGRTPVTLHLQPPRAHRHKDLKQQYIAMTLPGATRGSEDYATEQVLLGVLSGGMSGRLFTEVREKQGLVYWVGAWNENPRGCGVIHLGASTTPERCEKTFQTLLRELERVGEDLTDAETNRARDQLIAHMQTEDDLTRARAANLSDDLFHFGRPIGGAARIAALRGVTRDSVLAYARGLQRDRLCVATLGPKALGE